MHSITFPVRRDIQQSYQQLPRQTRLLPSHYCSACFVRQVLLCQQHRSEPAGVHPNQSTPLSVYTVCSFEMQAPKLPDEDCANTRADCDTDAATVPESGPLFLRKRTTPVPCCSKQHAAPMTQFATHDTPPHNHRNRSFIGTSDESVCLCEQGLPLDPLLGPAERCIHVAPHAVTSCHVEGHSQQGRPGLLPATCT